MRINYAAIVDDDAEVLDLIEQILSEESLKVSRFYSAEELLKVLPEASFDVIISDLLLPGMSGLELLDEVHLLDYQIPLILLTGYASLEQAIQAVNRGAFHYIKKPFNIEEVRLAILRLEQHLNTMAEIKALNDKIQLYKDKLEATKEDAIVDVPRQPAANPYGYNDLSKVFNAIEHLGKLKNDGHISEEEYGEYRGKLLKRIV